MLRSLCILAVLVGCGTSAPEGNDEPFDDDLECEGIEVQARAVFATNCEGCHSGDNPKAGFGAVMDATKMIAVGKVTPENPEASPVYVRMENGTMPPSGRQPRPSARDVAVIETWIECGAEVF
jgi:mono/diheme cytochrome c family protein